MADPTPAAWKRVATAVAPTLPGEWQIGGRGMKLVLARTPIEWTLVWIGVSRVRRDDAPHLMGGSMSLLGPVSGLTFQYGRRSDSVPGFPPRVDLTAPDAVEVVRRFAVEGVLPGLERWTDDARIAEAELQVTQAESERVFPQVWADAAGWRVVRGAGSPVDVAERAVAEAERWDLAEGAAWYRGLIDAWETGGRELAMTYLTERRAETLNRLGVG